MENPLINTKVIKHTDPYTDEEIIINMANIGKYFKHVYCLCPFDKIDINMITQQTIDKDVFNKLTNDMIIYKTNISMLKNIIHFSNVIHCDKSVITKSNRFGYDLEEMVLVLPIFNISFLNLTNYIDNMIESTSFNKLYDTLIISDYYGDKKDKLVLKMKINNMIKTLEESYYWTFPYNCLMNLSKLFDKRQFNLKIVKYVNNSKHILDIIDQSKIKENYLQQIFNSKQYVDPSAILDKKGYKLFNKVHSCDYMNDDINKLFDSIDDYQKYMMFSMLCCSKQYCHLIVNNKTMLIRMKSVIKENIALYKYLFGYAWIRFYFEETINRNYVKTTDMYIFDIDTATELPVFHYNILQPHENPYHTLLVAEKMINPELNIGGIVHPNDKTKIICNLSEFKQRMNIFISGNEKIDLFEGFDFNSNNTIITGSIMTACVQYSHPLINLFVNNITKNDINMLYNRFFDEYYYEADVDIAVYATNTFQFIDISRKIHEHLMLTICQHFDCDPIHIKFELVQSTYLFVTSEMIEKNICNESLKYDMVVANLNKPEIKKLFIPFAYIKLEEENKKLMETYPYIVKDNYKEVFEFSEDDIIIKLFDPQTFTTMKNVKLESDFTPDELDHCFDQVNEKKPTYEQREMMNGCGFTNNFKVKITCPHLSHDFEIFPNKKEDHMSLVANFHMPCVRAYYNGNVYMTPSFITAHMTYMNIDYKYVAGNKDPLEIINKYRMRGFGTWLNNNEITTYIKYISDVPFWNNLFGVLPQNKKTYSKCLGSLQMNHKLFHPRRFNIDIITSPKARPLPIDNPYNENIKTQIYSMSEFYNKFYSYGAYYMCQCLEDTTINITDGYIKPLNISLIEKHYTHKTVQKSTTNSNTPVTNTDVDVDSLSESEDDY